MEITIDDKLYRNISDYCEVNQLDFCIYVNKLLKDSFMIDKYGESPFAKALQQEALIMPNDDVQDAVNVEEEKEAVVKVEEPVQEIKKEEEVKKTIKKESKKEEKKEEPEPQVDSEPKIKEEPKKVLVKRRVLK